MKKLIYSMVALAMTAMTFTSCEDVPMPYNLPQKEDVKPLPEAKGSGTKEDPYNVAAALGKIKAQAANVNTEPMYVKGKIASISSVETATYGNATYYISDDGTATNQLYIFQSLYLGNKKFTSQEQIKVGDEVVVYGPFVNYNGNKPETVGKGATYLYSLNGKTEEGGNTGGETGTPKGDGTQASPFNAAAAAKAAKALDESGKVENVYITGIVSSVKDVNTQYGNATYAISDDGKEAGQFSVFRGLYLDGAKFTSADQIKLGQKVVILGTLVNYKGNTPQVAQGSKIISIDGGSTTPETPQTGEKTITIDATGMGFTKGQPLTVFTSTDGTKLEFAQGSGKSAPAYYDGTYASVRMYAQNTLTVTATKEIAKIVIMTSDPYTKDGVTTKYNGNNEAFAQVGANKFPITKDSDTQISFNGLNGKNVVINNDFTESKGGIQLRVKSIIITYK